MISPRRVEAVGKQIGVDSTETNATDIDEM